MILPTVLITLLDVTSYVIARTLLVLDDVKASTSDKITIHAEAERDREVPSIVLTESSPTPASAASAQRLPNEFKETASGAIEIIAPVARHTPPQTFFASDDMQLKLSGEGVFSPAVSAPPSPTLKRRTIANLERTTDEE